MDEVVKWGALATLVLQNIALVGPAHVLFIPWSPVEPLEGGNSRGAGPKVVRTHDDACVRCLKVMVPSGLRCAARARGRA